MNRNDKNNSKKAKLFFIIVLFSIVGSFFHIYVYALPDYRELFNPYTDRTNSFYTQYFQLCVIANDHVDPGNNVLFVEYNLFRFAHPYLYPYIICKYYNYSNSADNSELISYMKDNLVNYVLIYGIPFPPSSNTTLFLNIDIEFKSTSYLLQVNRSAL